VVTSKSCDVSGSDDRDKLSLECNGNGALPSARILPSARDFAPADKVVPVYDVTRVKTWSVLNMGRDNIWGAEVVRCGVDRMLSHMPAVGIHLRPCIQKFAGSR
jgi:hypothetical protein